MFTGDTIALSHFLRTRPTAFYLPRVSNTGPDIVFHIESDRDISVPVVFWLQKPKFLGRQKYFDIKCVEIAAEDLWAIIWIGIPFSLTKELTKQLSLRLSL
jgi:hypothetical protein